MDYESTPSYADVQAEAVNIEGTVNAADLYTPSSEGSSAPDTPTGKVDAPDAGSKEAERTFTQSELNRQIAKRLKEERKKAAYQLGIEMLNERMSAGSVSEAEALAAIREERIKAKAAQFKADPAKGFEELMRERYSQQQSGTDDSPETKVASLTQELMTERAEGKIPRDFELNDYMSDPERARRFLAIREKLGVEEAVRIAKLEVGQRPTRENTERPLPKPISTNNAYQPRTVDYSAMPAREFAKLREEIRRQANSGRVVKI